MRIAQSAALALLMMTITSAALADVKTFTYQLPTAFDDGSPLTAAQLAGVNVRCGRATGGPYATYVSPLIPPASTTHQNDFAAGAWFCVATATATAAAGGKTSVFSNQATFTVAPAPRAPAAFSVE